MIEIDSPFFALPANLDPKQMLFFDGIRHAAEMTDLAYRRLVEELTTLALTRRQGHPVPTNLSDPFLNAWAVVDSIHRLRGLLHLLPGVERRPRSDGKPNFRVQTEAIHNLRNVSDHLAERVDYVLGCKGTAFGVLSWVTIMQREPLRMLSCAIRPGTLSDGFTPVINPANFAEVPFPLGLITLAAGEHSASLSDGVAEVRRVVGSLEEGLRGFIEGEPMALLEAGADIIVVVEMEVVDD